MNHKHFIQFPIDFQKTYLNLENIMTNIIDSQHIRKVKENRKCFKPIIQTVLLL